MTTTAQLTITPIAVPESLEAPEAARFAEIARLGNAVCAHDAGHRYFDEEPGEMLPAWRDQTDHTRVALAAERDGVIVGIATLDMPNQEGSRTVEFDVLVEPDLWGQGIEDALHDAVEREARRHGRPIIQTWTLHRTDATGERLASPTGFGSIPANDRQTRFLLAQGFAFEQTERNSIFDLHGSFDLVESMLSAAVEAAGPDYELVAWTAPTPAPYRDGFAYALSRMSTDVPTAGLVWEEEIWDAARIERRDARLLSGGHTVSVACVVHVPSGRIVAFNELVIGVDHHGATHQFGTLVVKEHRGRRLGTIVKCANLLRWRDLVPTSPRVSTFNAEENRPMLDINEAIGFVPASYAGAWKKVLDES